MPRKCLESRRCFHSKWPRAKDLGFSAQASVKYARQQSRAVISSNGTPPQPHRGADAVMPEAAELLQPES